MEGTQQPRRMRFSWGSRCRIVVLIESGMSPPDAAARCGASRATGYRVWRRYRDGGWAALRDRASTPRRQPRRLSVGEEREMIALRQRTLAGPVVIAAITGRPASTVGKVLRRWGCSRLPKPERDPVRRYERERPGELLHVDTKKLGRFQAVGKRILKDPAKRNRHVGWQHLHIAIDDHTRLAYAEVLAGQDKQPAPHSSAAPWPGTPSKASRSNASCQTTPRPTTRGSGRTPAPSSTSPAATRGPTRPGPTAKPKR